MSTTTTSEQNELKRPRDTESATTDTDDQPAAKQQKTESSTNGSEGGAQFDVKAYLADQKDKFKSHMRVFKKVSEFLEDPEAINLEINAEFKSVDVVKTFAHIISHHMQRMQYLALTNSRFNTEKLKILTDVTLRNKNMKLLWFHLISNKIGDEGAMIVADALKENNTVISLNLDEGGITSKGAAAILDALKGKSIQDLLLVGNQIDNVPIRDFLVNTKTLTTLNLSQNPVRDSFIKDIALGLKDNTTLKHLHLWESNIGADGVKALADALEVNNHLQELTLSHNPLGNSGAKVIAKMLKVNSGLEILDLFDCKIGKEGATDIASALLSNKTLKTLNLKDNYTKKEDVQALKKAAQQNGVCKVGVDAKEETESEEEGLKDDGDEDEYVEEEEEEDEEYNESE